MGRRRSTTARRLAGAWAGCLVLAALAGVVLALNSRQPVPVAQASGRTHVFLPGIGTLAQTQPVAIPPLAVPDAPRAQSPAERTQPAAPTPTVPSAQPAAPTPTVPSAPTPTADLTVPERAFYVSPNGSDTSDGRSPATAWRTFAHVNSGKVPSGSAVLAEAGGVWDTTVKAPTDDLYFGVYGDGPRPKIIAPDGGYAFYADWKRHIRLVGWELTSATRRAGRWGILHVSHGDYVVRDVVVHGADGWMVVVRGPRGVVEGSQFYDNDGQGETSAVSVGGYEGTGRPSPADVTVFRNNLVRDTLYRGIATWGTNVIIEGNRVERWTAADRRGSTTQAPAGIYVPSRFLGDVVVRNNTLVGAGHEQWGLWVDYGPEHRTVVEGNVVSNTGGCMWAEKTSNVVFRGNRCEAIQGVGVRWGSGSGDLDGVPSLGGTIADNVFVGPQPRQSWIQIFPGSAASVEDNRFLP